MRTTQDEDTTRRSDSRKLLLLCVVFGLPVLILAAVRTTQAVLPLYLVLTAEGVATLILVFSRVRPEDQRTSRSTDGGWLGEGGGRVDSLAFSIKASSGGSNYFAHSSRQEIARTVENIIRSTPSGEVGVRASIDERDLEAVLPRPPTDDEEPPDTSTRGEEGTVGREDRSRRLPRRGRRSYLASLERVISHLEKEYE